MRILMIHNYYQFSGGEDIVFNAEKKLLQENGHEVIEYVRDNHEVQTNGLFSTGIQSLWSIKTYVDLSKLIKRTKPDIAHFHNTFFMISPSAYYACHHSHIPVVQTLHNYRLICPAATLLRNDKICEICIHKKIQWPGVLYGCWQYSRMKSAMVAIHNGLHHFLGTWKTKIDRYIVLTDFCRQKFLESGLPVEKIVVKPNFLFRSKHFPGKSGEYVLFIGRICKEKGLDILLQAWKSLPEIPLKIVGDGPLIDSVRAKLKTDNLNQVELVGRLSNEKILEMISKARYLVIPSILYETFSMVVIESYSCGIPVIVPDTGNFKTLVYEARTGLLFHNSDPSDLAKKAQWAWDNPVSMIDFGKNALEEYEQKYTAEQNYQQLMQIYNDVISNSKSKKK